MAPNLFNVLRGAGLANASELAGSIVTRLLAIVNSGGFEISLFLIIIRYFADRNPGLLTRLVEMISLAIMAIMTGISQWVIPARMVALRAAMQVPIDQVANSDPRRVAFDNLHRYSVDVFGVAMVAALVAFIGFDWSVIRLVPARPKTRLCACDEPTSRRKGHRGQAAQVARKGREAAAGPGSAGR